MLDRVTETFNETIRRIKGMIIEIDTKHIETIMVTLTANQAQAMRRQDSIQGLHNSGRLNKENKKHDRKYKYARHMKIKIPEFCHPDKPHKHESHEPG